MIVWEAIEGFSPAEQYNNKNAWSTPYEMNGLILLLLSAVRKSIRKLDPDAYIVIHAGYATGGHTSRSQHYKGNAVDFHIVTEIPYDLQVGYLLNIFKELQVFNRVGFGIYPDWNSPGFHLDCRGELARWGYIGEVIHFGLEGFAEVYAYTTAKFKEKESNG